MLLDGKPQISVIIPVYNVELYLRKCLDSVLNQTYRNLEIILVDDGSTDNSGAICDEYSEKDARIQVYHTENRGLSAARNLGLNETNGEWIGFVDSDDWIDPDLFQRAIDSICTADILCFSKNEGIYTGVEALAENISGTISSSAWRKLYRKECFLTVRFPLGRVYEDAATTYKVLNAASFVRCCKIDGYHYRRRPGSITSTYDMANIVGYWLAMKERYEFCMPLLSNYSIEQRKVLHVNLLRSVAISIARAWGWRSSITSSDSSEWDEMCIFAKTMFPYRIRKNFSIPIRVGLLFARFNHPFSFWIAGRLHALMRKVRINR